MLLNHKQILRLIHKNNMVENTSAEYVNGTSLDVTLGATLLVENEYTTHVNYSLREPLSMTPVTAHKDAGYCLSPGEFVLAQTEQVFHLPSHISAEYKLKSSMGRIGLEHLNAGWCDSGWHGSVLTLELINLTRYHKIILRPGDRIGQVIFFAHAPVNEAHSYANTGRYNNDRKVIGIKP